MHSTLTGEQIAELSRQSVTKLYKELAYDEELDFTIYMIIMEGITKHHNCIVETLNLEDKESYLIKKREVSVEKSTTTDF